MTKFPFFWVPPRISYSYYSTALFLQCLYFFFRVGYLMIFLGFFMEKLYHTLTIYSDFDFRRVEGTSDEPFLL